MKNIEGKESQKPSFIFSLTPNPKSIKIYNPPEAINKMN